MRWYVYFLFCEGEHLWEHAAEGMLDFDTEEEARRKYQDLVLEHAGWKIKDVRLIRGELLAAMES